MRVSLVGAVAVAALLAAGCGDELGSGGGSQAADLRYEGSFTVLESPEHGPELCHAVEQSLPPQCGGLPIVGWDWDSVDGEESQGGTTWGSWHVVGTYDSSSLTLTETPGPPQRTDDGDSRDFSPACDDPEVVDDSHGEREFVAGELDIPDLVAAWVSRDGSEFVGNVIVLPGAGNEARDLIRGFYGGRLCVVEREGPTTADLMDVQRALHDADARANLGDVQSASSDHQRGVVVATIWVVTDNIAEYAADRWDGLVELLGLLTPVE